MDRLMQLQYQKEYCERAIRNEKEKIEAFENQKKNIQYAINKILNQRWVDYKLIQQ